MRHARRCSKSGRFIPTKSSRFILLLSPISAAIAIGIAFSVLMVWEPDHISDACADTIEDVLADMRCERARESDSTVDCSNASPLLWGAS